MAKPQTRQQQKVYLSAEARDRLRGEADKRDLQMSEVVEHLIIEGTYPATPTE